MTASTASTINDYESVSCGLVESASVNSFSDFIPSKFNSCQTKFEKQDQEFKNDFICHMIFYAFLCLALVLHIFIDLGLGSFIKNKFNQLIGLGEKTVFEKSPALA